MRRLTRATFPWSVYNLKDQAEAGFVTFTNSSQRGLKWDTKRKSELVESVLNGIYIGPFICNKKGDEFDVLDGKQRGNTLIEYVNDGFAISEALYTTLNSGEEVELAGKKYSELPEELQQRIINENLEIHYYENLEEYECAEIIRRANNGKPMTAVEKARIGAASLTTYKEMADHPLFEEILTPVALNGNVPTEIIGKTIILLYSDKKCFDNAVFEPIVRSFDLSDEQKNEITSIYDYAQSVYELLTADKKNRANVYLAKKVVRKKLHLLSLIPFMKEASENGINELQFIEWMKDFFYTEKNDKVSKDDAYNLNCMKGTGHEGAVLARNEELKKSFDNFDFSSVSVFVDNAGDEAEEDETEETDNQ